MTGREAFHSAALADIGALRARHPAVFGADWAGRAARVAVGALLLGLTVLAVARLDLAPARVWRGLGELGSIAGMMLPPVPKSMDQARLFLAALAETVAIAFLGTLAGAVLAFPLALMGARNTTVGWIARLLARRTSDTIRAIDQLIWALIWVSVVGLGPFAGVLAVATADIGSLSKLFSETLETADRKPVEGVVSAGGDRAQAIRFGVLPQVLPTMLGQALYFFESNTRSSTIIGIVGAGGIGLHLSEQVRTLEFQSVGFIVLSILTVVAAIDWLSGVLRRAAIGAAPRG